jgi:tRNA nucleotidyltransferase/poly(A) polymerase
MRGIRFVSELDFTLGDRECTAYHEQAELLKKISVERIDQEMTRVLAGPAANRAIRLLFSTGCIRALPLLTEVVFPKPNHSVKFSLLESDAERWAAFLNGTGIDDITAFARAWKWSGILKKHVAAIIAFGKIREAGDWNRLTVYQAGPQCAAAVERFLTAAGAADPVTLKTRLQTIHTLWTELPVHHKGELAVNGRDLIRWSGQKPGPWLSETINKLEQSVVNGEIKNRTEAIQTWFSQLQAARGQKS